MPRKLSPLTLEELQSEMSIAGSPDKIAELIKKIYELSNTVDQTNVSEIQNIGLGLRWVIARLNRHLKYLERQRGQTYERI